MYVIAENKSWEFLLNVPGLFKNIFFDEWRRRLHVDASYFFDNDARDSTSTMSQCFLTTLYTRSKVYCYTELAIFFILVVVTITVLVLLYPWRDGQAELVSVVD